MMSTSLQEFFASYESRPVSVECYKQLGLLLQRSPPDEIERFLLAYHPTKLHLQLLRVLACRSIGSQSLLLDGVRSQSKELAKFCTRSASLFSNVNGDLYDPNILLGLLQTVSLSIRNKIVSNLARHMTDGNEEIVDCLFRSMVDLWGPASAMTLLCRTSESVIQRELENGRSLSSFQILTIVRRYPRLAMELLEKVPLGPKSLRAARILVRNNLPQSLNFCLKNRNHQLLSKSTMRVVLKKYVDIIMASAPDWADILNPQCVKKALRPETFELFVLKRVERELKNTGYVSSYPPSYIQHLSPKAVSSLMSKVSWAAIDDFWENNESLIKLLDTVDRNKIASELFEKTKSLDWVTYMSCDLSIAIIKENLTSEANGHVRARLVEKLLATVEINKDKKALEETCEWVAVRYRNDREVLSSFFEHLPDMSLTEEKTWALVYSLGVKSLDSSSSNYCYGIGRLFSAALKRNGRSGLKIYINRFFDQRMLTNANQDFTDLAADLQEECLSLVFSNANIASDDPERERCLLNFLPIISKWNASVAHSIKAENVETFVLNNLSHPNAVAFVLCKCNGFTMELIEKCFEKTGNPDFLECMVQRKAAYLAVSRAAVTKMADELIERGCWKYIKLLKTLQKKGYLEILSYLYVQTYSVIRDPKQRSLRHAIILLSLTASPDDYLHEVETLLVETNGSQELATPYHSHPEPVDCHEQENILQLSQHRDSIYRGIGNSFSFVDQPSLIVHLLSRFCTSGDTMLFVRDSVYSVSLALSMAGAKEFLSVLVHKPVSVMKHALRLHRLVSDIKAQKEFLTELGQTETHVTSRTCLFEYALTLLNDTKNIDIWEAVKDMMLRLTPKDKALVTVLLAKKVPVLFWEEYVSILLEKAESLEEVTVENVSSILNTICYSIHTLPISNQFLERLTKDYFLSERYFAHPQSHDSVCNLLLAYLKQKPGLVSCIKHKRLVLTESLDLAATKKAIVMYDARLGYHPTATLLSRFVQLFSAKCRRQQGLGAENENHLSAYVDTLLSFFARIDENLLFGCFVCISLTGIMCSSASTAGRLVGQFIDEVYAKNAGLAQYALPVFMQSYFAESKLDACFLQDILLSPKSLCPDILLLRTLIVAKILPGSWKKDKSLESFREKFFALVRNTPCEVVLFSDQG